MILDEERNAADFLNKSVLFLQKIDKDRVYLKWFTIAFHGAVHSFILLKLQSVSSELIFADNKTHSHSLDRNLKSFKKAYLSLKNPNLMKINIYKPEGNQDKCIDELNDRLRNQMIHFRPTLWASEPWYFAEACYPLLSLLKFCIEDNHLLNNTAVLLFKDIEIIKQILEKHRD